MTNKQDITVLKRSPRSYCLSMGGLKACKLLAQGVAQCRQHGPEKALKERHQQHRATPSRGRKIMVIVNSSERAISLAQGNALCRSKRIHTKPQRGVIRYISFDYALSGLNRYCASLIRRALPYAIDYALSGLITSSDHDRATPCVGNAPLAMKPQRGVIRLISFDYALSGLRDMVHPRFAGRCPTLLITFFQSLLRLPTTTGRCPALLITPFQAFQGLAFAGHSSRRALSTLSCAQY